MCPKCLIVAGLMSEVGADLQETIDPSVAAATGLSYGPSAVQTPAAGRVFGGYHIIRPLGKGGMGTVYEAEEQATGRRLALKVLSHSLDSEQARTRFFREGRLAASVNHPNSVYVFGTEEIDDMPVITMELAHGGTLHELVKRRGPLPIAEAVDTILQITAGLEAAAAGGVLHRDVKPSNCFIDTDGTVKIGDFGLSISTLARRDTNITHAGTLLGTPAYASPEQLRGDEIDQRSDIYAVGVTLYYLLTARLPFSADNMVQMLATVLEQPAKSPREVRRDIPEELARVILRCLAKLPAQRFKNYNELRLALLPFTSTAPLPANLGLRLLAGVLDFLVVVVVGMAALVGSLSEVFRSAEGANVMRFGRFFGFVAGMYLLPVLLFIFPEGLWGATLGKAILGLRVVGLKRTKPGLLRALLRTVVVFATFMAASLLSQLYLRGHLPNSIPFSILSYAAMLMPYACLILLFVTARRRNGNAALQDLLSGTRVVMKRNWQTRIAATPAPQPPAAMKGEARFGPYQVLGELGRADESAFFLGYDARLFRKVWIRQLPPDAADVPGALRELSRRGRLRWLGGKRGEGSNWDAYEALTGQPLVTMLHQQPWKRVRFWLADLAEELQAAAADRTLPASLTLEQVWITEDGRAKLLDFPAPGVAASLAAPAPATAQDVQSFLKQVAMASLEGLPPSNTGIVDGAVDRPPHRQLPNAGIGVALANSAPGIPLPLHARKLVTQIGQFADLNALLVALRATQDLPSEITPVRRLVLLAGCVVPPAMFVLVGLVFLGFFWVLASGAGKTAPELRQFTELKLCLNQLQSMKKTHRTDGMDQSLEIYIAGRFKDLVTNSKAWHNELYKDALTSDQRKLAEEIVASRSPVSPTAFADAAQRVKPLGVDLDAAAQMRQSVAASQWKAGTAARIAMAVPAVWAFYIGLPALIAAGLFRGGLLVHSLGLAFVTRDGVPARRWRIFCRGLIVWLPPLLVFLLLPLPISVGLSVLCLSACVYVGAALWSLRTPQRTLADLIAGTRMVMR
jgi:hypothetical protein